MNSYETISESKKSVEGLYEAIKDLIKNIKRKEEFSTSISHNENLGSNIDIKTSAKSFNSSSYNINIKEFHNQNLFKKIEEIENSYNEILKNFNMISYKYKLVKEENKKVEENNITLLEQLSILNDEYNKLFNDYSEANITIERFKEIDKCLVDSTINCLFLNTNLKKPAANLYANNNNKEEGNSMISYLLCEPVPTFVKFINKFTK
jgi:predicted nuclease with TOPRIM domain